MASWSRWAACRPDIPRVSGPFSGLKGKLQAAHRGHRGMPGRISPRPAPTSGRRPSMAGSGHPPASAAGSELSWRRDEDQGQWRKNESGRLHAAPTATLLLCACTEAGGRLSQSRAPGGVRTAGHGWPAAGRGSWTRTPAGGAHPPVRVTGGANHHEATRTRTDATAGTDLSSRRGRIKVNDKREPLSGRGRLQRRPLLLSAPKPAYAEARRVHRGVCGQPAMDGRRPAVVAGRGLRPGEHTPRCARRAARTTTKQSHARMDTR